MRDFIIGVGVLLIVLLLAYKCEQSPRRTERAYSGTVVLLDTHRGAEAGGPWFFVYYHCPEIGKDIKVSVTASEFSRRKKGDKVTYYITPRQAEDYRDTDIIFPNGHK